MIENLWYSYALFEKDWARDLNSRNEEWIKIYKQLKKEGYRQLYYVSAESLVGKPYEGTVDGTHLTDLGTQIFSDNLCKTLKKCKLK
jgi:lysophospholipase L1-like esterase